MTLTMQAVLPGEIQDRLNKIWESLETKNVTRASLFNLVFYCRKNSRTAYVQKVAQKVIEKFPSRVIFIAVDKEAAHDFLKTEVSIFSSSHGEFDVACDYIQIEAGGVLQSRVPFVVLPHILPDLPVYLAWAEDPCQEDPLFNQLNAFASRLICDSETTDDLPSFCKHIVEHYETTNIDIADLNWARIESWRDLLSMVFYSEANLDRIKHAKRIELNYNGKESAFFCHTRIQAIYLQGWIACQLNWEYLETSFDDKKDMHFSYRSPYGTVEVILSSTMNPKLPPGLILTCDIITFDEHAFSFARDLEQIHRITFHSSSDTQCDLPVIYILQKAESGHSLVKEVTHRGTSKHFLRVLHLLKRIDYPGIC